LSWNDVKKYYFSIVTGMFNLSSGKEENYTIFAHLNQNNEYLTVANGVT